MMMMCFAIDHLQPIVARDVGRRLVFSAQPESGTARVKEAYGCRALCSLFWSVYSLFWSRIRPICDQNSEYTDQNSEYTDQNSEYRRMGAPPAADRVRRATDMANMVADMTMPAGMAEWLSRGRRRCASHRCLPHAPRLHHRAQGFRKRPGCRSGSRRRAAMWRSSR